MIPATRTIRATTALRLRDITALLVPATTHLIPVITTPRITIQATTIPPTTIPAPVIRIDPRITATNPDTTINPAVINTTRVATSISGKQQLARSRSEDLSQRLGARARRKNPQRTLADNVQQVLSHLIGDLEHLGVGFEAVL